MMVSELGIRLSKFPPLHCSAAVRFPLFEFHILAEARDRYQFDESLYSTSGNVIFPNFHAARVFAKQMNDRRDLVNHPEQSVRAGQLNALGLIDEIYHYILRVYEETTNHGVFGRAHSQLVETMAAQPVDRTMETFVTLFPPLGVYKGILPQQEYLGGASEGRPNRQVTIEELMLLYLINFNPAAKKFSELFTDDGLSKKTQYQGLIGELENFFKKEKAFGPENQTIFDLLRTPILAHPDSLEAQLGFIKTKWGMLLSQKFLDKILGSVDLIQEENKIVHGGGGVSFVPAYKSEGSSGHLVYGSFEAERFTADLDWMPKVVLLAKNTYVWLHQLSKKFGRPITTLDQIPDEELDQLARWNFTGLWLIGLWERSSASQKIKQWTGNPEAVPSAYSLYEYEIARDLGGEEAFQNLNRRAWHRGIRLAGDMVPNHMGIYSRWVIEHPEYFIQSEYCPFPNYRFTGGDLSENPDVQLRIEDGYWSRKDAAVVFQRIDNRSGRVAYMYHGNDGTNMPWNDTAQLDLLRSDVREAVIQTIFHVARKFSIIRFDAAMTLTKKHFQRLWFPQPGTGGDIPSRADHSLSKEQFDKLFPNEFWREVVDRINQYMPSTLLLAEAFWLMEGYFVRTLGMHRVYNSAFMHMLMKEENEKYHLLITNTLEYNPEILKRYVNFMSNPDEQTAIAQFGKEDKYFGVALMMVTLPGLPMFGHGQIEGFTEKYGMEYKKAYYDEFQDNHLVRRHEHEIFPIMNKRHLFSDVTNFEFYPFHDARGSVNHNVFAYSNVSGNERALIFFHNKFQECKGWIRWSSPKALQGGGGERNNASKTLGEALRINSGEKFFYVFRDYKSNLEFVRSGKEIHERGMYAELKAFEYQVFLDFREVEDHTGEYSRIARHLHGKGVQSVQQVLLEMRLAPVHEELKRLLSKDNVEDLTAYCLAAARQKSASKRLHDIETQFAVLCEEVGKYKRLSLDPSVARSRFIKGVDAIAAAWMLLTDAAKSKSKIKSSARKGGAASADMLKDLAHSENLLLLYCWATVEELALLLVPGPSSARIAEAFNELDLAKSLSGILHEHGRSRGAVRREISLVRILARHSQLLIDADAHNRFIKMEQLFDDYEVREFINVNLHEGTWFFNKESMQELLRWLFLISIVQLIRGGTVSVEELGRVFAERFAFIRELEELSASSGFDMEKLRVLLSP